MDNKTNYLVKSGLFLAIAVIFQVIGKALAIPQFSQLVVGTVVNAVIILAVLTCGTWWGTAIGALTPFTAWLIGQLNPAMLPFIPFIMAGNIIYALIFGLLMNKGKAYKYVGYVLGAFAKYIFLYFTASKFLHLLVKVPEKVLKVLIASMGIPQFITALIGGALAITIAAMLEKRYNKNMD